MSNKTLELPPLSDAARLDTEIAKRMHRISSGNATTDDIAAASSMIRDRANLTLPKALLERRDRRRRTG